jgi:hypothetical protein
MKETNEVELIQLINHCLKCPYLKANIEDKDVGLDDCCMPTIPLDIGMIRECLKENPNGVTNERNKN